MRQSTDYERCIVRCPICKEFVNSSYPQYLELLKFLREEIFLIRPHFYNRQAHGKSLKWYWYNLARGVIPEREQDNNYLFKERLEESIRRKFPSFYRRVLIRLVDGNVSNRRMGHLKAIIVKFQYHEEFHYECRGCPDEM